MTIGGARNVLVPGAAEGVVQANALKAVIEADGPVKFSGSGGEERLGQVEETGEKGGIVHDGWMIRQDEWRLVSMNL